jgi:hypothetical protein
VRANAAIVSRRITRCGLVILLCWPNLSSASGRLGPEGRFEGNVSLEISHKNRIGIEREHRTYVWHSKREFGVGAAQASEALKAERFWRDCLRTVTVTVTPWGP